MTKFFHIAVEEKQHEEFHRLKPSKLSMSEFMQLLLDSYKDNKLKHKLKSKTIKGKLKEIMDLIETSKRLGLDCILIVGEKEEVYEIDL